MKDVKTVLRVSLLASLSAVALWLTADRWVGYLSAHDDRPALATQSSPIAITSNDRYVWRVNPENDSVSLFHVIKDRKKKFAEIKVGREPWCLAITPDDRKAYVTN